MEVLNLKLANVGAHTLGSFKKKHLRPQIAFSASLRGSKASFKKPSP
jgi:hypothetical protein